MELGYWIWLRGLFRLDILRNFLRNLIEPDFELIISIIVACIVIGWFGLGERTPFTLFVLLLFFPITHSIYRNKWR